jgi:glycosyltransferase involved in cell wall biosynthesis
MNKTMEYMAFGLPVVAFDLVETKVSAGSAAVYAEPNKVEAFAAAIVDLLDDPQARATMGRLGRQRVVDELAWQHQEKAYVGVVDRLAGVSRDQTPAGELVDRVGQGV